MRYLDVQRCQQSHQRDSFHRMTIVGMQDEIVFRLRCGGYLPLKKGKRLTRLTFSCYMLSLGWRECNSYFAFFMDFDFKTATHMRREKLLRLYKRYKYNNIYPLALPLHGRGQKFESSIAHTIPCKAL